ncbi:hypothetical protein POSPLADRAFT_1131341 [Postia placenta MAD-698-R-SB12]|uniref:Uncharacterized protein n=1 Tax=Postia placenta MAD-698-R-SB12 TaxID=670580 RepID=A0A1X6NDU1_9APHY|nr:hypothetical protein POSPLADRAFT_1131341 [Postia placenta MAD-698-R-SB12]OSX66672.1 hypothetical protein POSPLADRAFT_1131341 [Postia placenta MAD-698-R-SB12]
MGVLSDGTFTVKHPWVSQYLDALARAYYEAIMKNEKDRPTYYWSPQPKTIQRLGSVEGVSGLLEMELDKTQSARILALAALRVFENPRHPAHFALWGRPTDKRSAQVVYEMIHHQIPLITSPTYWMGNEQMLYHLHRQQAFEFPLQNRAHPKNDDEEDRLQARKAVAEAAAQRATIPRGVRRIIKAGSSPELGIPVTAHGKLHASTPALSTMAGNDEAHVVTVDGRPVPVRRSCRQAAKQGTGTTNPSGLGSSTAVNDMVAPSGASRMGLRGKKRKATDVEEAKGPLCEAQSGKKNEVRSSKRITLKAPAYESTTATPPSDAPSSSTSGFRWTYPLLSGPMLGGTDSDLREHSFILMSASTILIVK